MAAAMVTRSWSGVRRAAKDMARKIELKTPPTTTATLQATMKSVRSSFEQNQHAVVHNGRNVRTRATVRSPQIDAMPRGW